MTLLTSTQNRASEAVAGKWHLLRGEEAEASLPWHGVDFMFHARRVGLRAVRALASS